jgi:capsular exopolysaccharide synthesis family protein
MSQFLSIRPKPQDFTSAAPPSPAGAPSPPDATPLALQEIPTEEVHIHSGTRIALYTDPRGLAADRFRFLRLRLRERADGATLKRILVTSPLPQDGKSTVALNLATALAERGKRNVLLLEADLYHATIAETLGIPARAGLAECLEAGLDPMSALRRLEPLGWYFLPGGNPQGNPTELLQSDQLPSVLGVLSRHFDWVVIDSAPVIPVTDAVSLARHADGTLLVVRAGRTPHQAVTASCKLLDPKHIIAIILNGVDGLDRVYSKYYGRYGGATSTSYGRSVEE